MVYTRRHIGSSALEGLRVAEATRDLEYGTGVGRSPEESMYDDLYWHVLRFLGEEVPQLKEICLLSELPRMYRGTRQPEGDMRVRVEEEGDLGTIRFPVQQHF